MSEQDPPADRHFPERLRKIAGENPSSFLLAGLLVLAVLYTLYFARAVLLPIVLASLLALILMPAVRALKRLHVPRGLGAALVVVALTGWGQADDCRRAREAGFDHHMVKPPDLERLQEWLAR